jgi:hypothetical protein
MFSPEEMVPSPSIASSPPNLVLTVSDENLTNAESAFFHYYLFRADLPLLSA